jgi:hypothetical protein
VPHRQAKHWSELMKEQFEAEENRVQVRPSPLTHTPLDTATRLPHHDGGTPWSEPTALRVGRL